MQFDSVTNQIIRIALDVHSALGPGLLESAYRACLAHDLAYRGVSVRTEVPLPVSYNGIRLELGYRMDLVVEEKVVVEVKTVQKLLPVHEAQLLSYLRLGNLPIGLLINFHVPRLRDGLKRMVN
jgi:GxxExxY protein